MTSPNQSVFAQKGDSTAKVSFLRSNESTVGQLNLIMRDRGWFKASHMFLEMVIVAERDSSFAEQFQRWLNREESTLLLWKLTEQFRSGFHCENSYLDARAGIDAAINIYSRQM